MGSNSKLTLLIAEDNPRDVKLVTAILEQAGYTFTWTAVDEAAAFERKLGEMEFDLIIADYNLRDWTAMDALAIVKRLGKEVPVIIVSGSLGDESAVDCIKHGATDYVLKDRMARLTSAVQHALEQKRLREQRAAADAALIESERRYRVLFESNPEPMWVYDVDSLQFLQVNNAAIDHYGYSRDEFLAMTIKDIRPEEDIPALITTVHRGTVGLDRSGIWRHRKKDGTIIDVEIISHRLEFAGKEAELVLANDITERQQADAALRASEERFRKIFSTAPDPTAICTADEARYIDINESFLNLTGYRRDEVVGKTALEVFWSRPSDQEEFLGILREQARVRDLDVKFRTKAGLDREGLLSAEIIELEGRQCVLTVTTDLTEWRKLERQLVQAQKMEAVGRLAGGIAHDFNNLLGVIIGYSDLLVEELSGQDRVRHRVQEIKKAGTSAATLTRQLLAFSRKQLLEPRKIDINSVVSGISSMLLRLLGEDVEFKVKLMPNPALTEADPSQIEQVIMNLAINARDAMPQGGTLTIETAEVAVDEVYRERHFQAVPPGRYIMLSVSDTGIGMSEEIKRQIFEPFFTTKEKDKGTGLGLSTVYGIVKQSNGFIWVYSEPGQGTTFKVYFPQIAETSKLPPVENVPVPLPRGSETILLVEDAASLRELNHELLESMGYTVLPAAHGAEALKISEQHSGPIHLLMTDVVMPGVSGRELAEQLALLRPEMRVLYVSGYTDTVVHQNLLKPGVAFLQKPFTRESLAKKLREVLQHT